MKINRSKSKTRWIIILVIVGILLAGGVFAFYQMNNNKDTPNSGDEVNYKEPTSDQIKAGNDAKKETIN
mgnify:CR=1 FL=1